jgi:hypothetical protein
LSMVMLYPLTYVLTNVLTAGDSQSASNVTLPLNGLGIQDCLVHTICISGIWRVYSGVTLALVGAMEHQISMVVLSKRFAATENPVKGENKNNSNGIWVATIRRFLYNQASGIVSCYIAFPLESVSRRLQVQSLASKQLEIETFDLYTGITPRLIKIVLVNSILTVCYSETSQDFVRRAFMKVFH